MMNTWTTAQWIAVLTTLAGVGFVWTGGQMGVWFLPNRPPSGPPGEWVPHYKRVLKWALLCITVGLLLVAGSVSVFAHFNYRPEAPAARAQSMIESLEAGSNSP